MLPTREDRAIMLDIDGVLNSEADYMADKNFRYRPISDEKVALLAEIVKATGAKLILSSSWRLINPTNPLRILLNDKLKEHGMAIEGEIPLDVSDRSVLRHQFPTRGELIQEWLERHPEVTSFIILDDDNDMGEHLPHLIQTSWRVGLTEKHVETAKNLWI